MGPIMITLTLVPLYRLVIMAILNWPIGAAMTAMLAVNLLALISATMLVSAAAVIQSRPTIALTRPDGCVRKRS